MDSSHNPALSFARNAAVHPERIALHVSGQAFSYGDLAGRVSRLAANLAPVLHTRRVGILATRSLEAYVGILSSGWAGAAYVPLNLKWPEARLIALMDLLGLDALVVDVNGAELLTPAVLQAAPALIVLADGARPVEARDDQVVVRFSALADVATSAPAFMEAGDLAYVIFTSGTTGLPKGVAISCGSLAHYVEQSIAWTGYVPQDRIGEACDVTFDLSVHNLFLGMRAGASLHVMSQLELLGPARFIRAHELTVWMSVPTVIGMMRRTGALKAGIFPSLRLSIFCGEPLPVSAAQAWAQATPNGVVENIYGPTEATVICMRQRLTDPPVVTESRGIVAIGTPYPTMQVAILDQNQKPMTVGVPGEIALCGPQVGLGYFGQPELTADRFRMIDGQRWYLTGDLGCRDDAGVYHHLGRVDNQVKVKGNRIELEEVDMHLRIAAGTELAATVAWPVTHGSAEGLVSFVAGTARSQDEIRQAMLAGLPRYMMPGTIHVLDALPQNINGKIDRGALVALLDQGFARPAVNSVPNPVAEPAI